jgi:hypothetical protein
VPLSVSPAATIFPLLWIASAEAASSLVPIAVVTVPFVPKVVSGVPFGW